MAVYVLAVVSSVVTIVEKPLSEPLISMTLGKQIGRSGVVGTNGGSV